MEQNHRDTYASDNDAGDSSWEDFKTDIKDLGSSDPTDMQKFNIYRKKEVKINCAIWNPYSNVAKLFDLYKKVESETKNEDLGKHFILKQYVEGIGTKQDEKDDILGSSAGRGEWGIIGRVNEGIKNLVSDQLQKNVSTSKKIYKIVFDVFGFSRGAAAARHFVFEVTKPKSKNKPARGHLGSFLPSNLNINKFQVRFVGLYDTVSSYGGNFNNDVEDLGLNAISHSSVKNVIQFAAGHEWRTNFSLTNINSAGEKGKQFKIPGAHADVGGCYESEVFKQNHSPSVSPAKVINNQNEYNNLANTKRKPFIDAGWYLEPQIKIGPHSNKYVNHIFLQGERYIDNRYSYIPLHFMCRLAKEKNAIFNRDGLEQKFKIPQKAGNNGTHILYYVKSQLEKYINETISLTSHARENVSYKKYLDFENEKKLINQYVHWSATGKTGHGPRKDGKRKIIPG